MVKIFRRDPPGFLFSGTDAQALAMTNHPLVARVEENGVFEMSATQLNPPWNLDRIDQVYLPLNNKFEYCTSGVGIRVYVIDTGVQATHQEFWTSSIDHTSRVADGWDPVCLGCEKDPYYVCGSASANASHGTAVASIIAGLTTGVAKGATIVPIRAVNCQARTDSGLLRAGLDAVEDLELERIQSQPDTTAIVNMSCYLEVTTYQATMVEDKIRTLIANPLIDLLFVTSANNQADDADNYIPSRMSEVFTVAASTDTDGHWPDSNFGPEVDLYAPGDDIDAAQIGEDDDLYRTELKSGTSFAAAMVSGVAARHAQGDLLDSGQIWQRLLDGSVPQITNAPAGTTNKLLNKRDRCRLVP